MENNNDVSEEELGEIVESLERRGTLKEKEKEDLGKKIKSTISKAGEKAGQTLYDIKDKVEKAKAEKRERDAEKDEEKMKKEEKKAQENLAKAKRTAELRAVELQARETEYQSKEIDDKKWERRIGRARGAIKAAQEVRSLIPTPGGKFLNTQKSQAFANQQQPTGRIFMTGSSGNGLFARTPQPPQRVAQPPRTQVVRRQIREAQRQPQETKKPNLDWLQGSGKSQEQPKGFGSFLFGGGSGKKKKLKFL